MKERITRDLANVSNKHSTDIRDLKNEWFIKASVEGSRIKGSSTS